jgi:mono/diheme cytochrome c family protein
MNKIGNAMFRLLAVVGAVALVAGIGFAAAGVAARPEPAGWESRLFRGARHLLVPRAARAARNPVPASAEVLVAAGRHWADHCATCHGNDGKGDTEIGRGLSPRAPDMTEPATQELADGELFWIIENGVRRTGMPAWGGEGGHGGADDSWMLVHFVRHLPELTAEELADLELHNPTISRAELERRLAGRAPPASEPPPHGQPGHHH